MFDQDANRLATTRLRETTEYYPHLSFSSNTTTVNSVFRYYTGAILNAGLVPRPTSSHIKAYGGIDFNRSERSGLSYNIAAVGYTNPDPEYYTPINHNALKSPYGINAAFKFGTDLNSPTLILNWNRNELSFGQSAAGTQLGTNENVFSIALRFGEPLNPAK